MSSSFEGFVHCDVIKPILSPLSFLQEILKEPSYIPPSPVEPFRLKKLISLSYEIICKLQCNFLFFFFFFYFLFNVVSYSTTQKNHTINSILFNRQRESKPETNMGGSFIEQSETQSLINTPEF